MKSGTNTLSVLVPDEMPELKIFLFCEISYFLSIFVIMMILSNA